MLQRCAIALALTFTVACGGSGTNNLDAGSTTSPIDQPTGSALVAGLGNASVAVGSASPQAALAAEAAVLAINSGVQASEVMLTASLIAGGPSRAALSSGSARAFGFQLQVLNLAGSSGPETFSGVLLFQGASDWVLVAGLSPGVPIPPSVGLLASGSQLWSATAGRESAQLHTEGASCGGSLPAGVTSCKFATFSTTGFTITSSTPVSGGAAGSKVASLPTGDLGAGVSLVIDCKLGTLCPGGSAGVEVSISPAVATVTPGSSRPFTANVTGTTDILVTWTVEEAGGGTITSGGLYTAPTTTGTYHVVATSHADPTKSAQATVTVIHGVTVTVVPAMITIAKQQTYRFLADVLGTTNTAVTWSVQEAGGGSISGDGTYSAPASAGTFHVHATSVSDPTAYGQATVNVTDNPPFKVTVSAQPLTTDGLTNLDCVASGAGPYTYAWHGYQDDGTTTGLAFSALTTQAPTVTLSVPGTVGANFYVYCVVTGPSNAVESGYTMVTLTTGDTIPKVTVGPTLIQAGATDVTFDGSGSLNAQSANQWTVQYGGNVESSSPEDPEAYLKVPAANWSTVFSDGSPSGLMETVSKAKFSQPGAYRVQLTVTSSTDYSQNEGTYYFQVVP
jgi:hypothetical protein